MSDSGQHSDPPAGYCHVVTLTVPGKMLSLNDILGKNRFYVHNAKKEVQQRLLSVLQGLDTSCSMKTISSQRVISTACATLESYLATRREKRASRRSRKSSPKTSRKG